jgi:hypothetical protein
MSNKVKLEPLILLSSLIFLAHKTAPDGLFALPLFSRSSGAL